MCRAIARCAFGPLAESLPPPFRCRRLPGIGRYLEIDMARLALLMFLLFVVGSMFFCLRDASSPEKASDDRAARCAGGDSAVLGGDLSNGREPVYLF